MARVSTCLLLHGAGSTPEFIERTFGGVMREAGMRLVAPDVRGLDMAGMHAVIDAAGADVMGGVSLGAHATGLYAATTGWSGPVYAVMPAWLGAASGVAGLTAQTAARLRASSVSEVLAEIRHFAPDDWVSDELARAWSSMTAVDLAVALEVAAVQPAPTREQLRAIAGPVTVVALADDPTHPREVAQVWAQECAGTLHVVPRDAGAAALARWICR